MGHQRVFPSATVLEIPGEKIISLDMRFQHWMSLRVEWSPIPSFYKSKKMRLTECNDESKSQVSVTGTQILVPKSVFLPLKHTSVCISHRHIELRFL